MKDQKYQIPPDMAARTSTLMSQIHSLSFLLLNTTSYAAPSREQVVDTSSTMYALCGKLKDRLDEICYHAENWNPETEDEDTKMSTIHEDQGAPR